MTPFYIDKERKHEDWALDEFRPLHVPAVGDLVFVDLTRERATELRRAYVAKWWDADVSGAKMSERWESQEEAVTDLVAGDLGHPGAPALVAVEGPWHQIALVANASAQAGRLGIVDHLLAARAEADFRAKLKALEEKVAKAASRRP